MALECQPGVFALGALLLLGAPLLLGVLLVASHLMGVPFPQGALLGTLLYHKVAYASRLPLYLPTDDRKRFGLL
jgi:hypothetical protein